MCKEETKHEFVHLISDWVLLTSLVRKLTSFLREKCKSWKVYIYSKKIAALTLNHYESTFFPP